MSDKPVILYGPDGLPIKRQELKQEISAPTLSGVRSAWAQSVVSGLTPSKLASILKAAAQGDSESYLVLAEEMEEMDLHYGSVLGTRKRAISGVDVIVTGAEEDAKGKEIAEHVKRLVETSEFQELLDELLDALGKGYSVAEIMWDKGALWKPKRYEWRDPRFFVFDEVTGREIRLKSEEDSRGIQLAPYKFIRHVPRLKCGLPIRGGLARMAAMGFMCKSYTVKDWMGFLEVFGMPLRIGKYGKSASTEDINTLAKAVANIGTDAAAIIPESMMIEFVEAAKGGTSAGAVIFKDTADWWDKQLSKGVLGQTASTDGTPGSLGNQDGQEDVRIDILRSDCRQLMITINRDLIKPFVDLNFGPQENYPLATMPVFEPEDVAALVGALDKLVPLGLEVSMSEVREKINLSEPGKGDTLLQVRSKPDTSLNHQHDCSCQGKALNAQEEIIEDPLEEIIDDELDDWEQITRPILDPVVKAISEANSYEEAIEKLEGLEGKLGKEDLIKSLTAAMFKAQAAGDVDG
ncbi:DUF935 domain-containing protein [Kiloniella litopenaei]|uniref:DUF935 domain-containing protein n=1 Tax=Kiloniella litopenaei TaxID=1549748 RepID=UPI003BAAFE1B